MTPRVRIEDGISETDELERILHVGWEAELSANVEGPASVLVLRVKSELRMHEAFKYLCAFHVVAPVAIEQVSKSHTTLLDPL